MRRRVMLLMIASRDMPTYQRMYAMRRPNVERSGAGTASDHAVAMIAK